MNLENAKKEFTKYVENYKYLGNEKIERKYGHSYRVMDAAGNIARSLNLSEEEVEIAELIGLLHDIGRFEQIKIYDTFFDHISLDHGDLGVDILKKDDYIRKYIQEDKYDSIIFKAIKNHNKFKIEEGLAENELLFAKIIRDADKLDIFYEGAEMFWTTQEERDQVGKSTITNEVLDDFKNHSIIDRKKMKTDADDILSFIGLIYDINFKYNYVILKREQYIDKIFDKFIFENEETAKIMQTVREIANNYLDSKI